MSKPEIRLLYKALLRRGSTFDKHPLLKAQYQTPQRPLFYVPAYSFQAKIRETFRAPLNPSTEQSLSQGFETYRHFGAIMTQASKQSPWWKQIEYDPNQIISEEPLVKSTQDIKPGTLLITHPLVSRPDLKRAIFLILQQDMTTTIAIKLNESSNFHLKLPGKLSRKALPSSSFRCEEIVNGGKFQFDVTGRDTIETAELVSNDEEIDENSDEELSGDEDDTTYIGTFEDSDDGEVSVIVTQLKEPQTPTKSKQLAIPPKKTQKPKSLAIPDKHKTIYSGGDKPGWIVLHKKEGLKHSHRCGPGLFFTTNNDAIQEVFKTSKPEDYRLFTGYNTFETPSLNQKIEQGAFILAHSTPFVFMHEFPSGGQKQLAAPLEAMWAQSLCLMGGEFYHFGHFDAAYANNASPTTAIE